MSAPPDPATPYPYGAQPYHPPPHPGAADGTGTTALVLGVLALVSCMTVLGGLVLGILAVVFGVRGRARARRAGAGNRGAATAGVALGAVSIGLAVAVLALGLYVFVQVGGPAYIRCLNDAHGDRAGIARCRQDFVDRVDRQRPPSPVPSPLGAAA